MIGYEAHSRSSKCIEEISNMGEEELRKFVKSRKGFGTDVSLVHLMRTCWEKSHEPPLLIVDALGYFRSIYHDPEHWIYNGQWKHCIKEVKQHVKELVDCLEYNSPLRRANSEQRKYYKENGEAKLVEVLFYINGSAVENTSRDNIAKLADRLTNIKNAFTEVNSGVIPYKIHIDLPLGMTDYVHYILKYECKVNVQCYMENMHREVARLAKENSACFGILSEDCEFLIYGAKRLLFAKSLNLTKMTVKTYSNAELAQSLKMTPNQLRLLSCLLGNSHISVQELVEFHQMIAPNAERSEYTLVHKVANRIKEREWKANTGALGAVARTVGIATERLRKAINAYDLHSAEEDINYENQHCRLRTKCFECECPAVVYSILHYKTFVESPFLEDSGDELLPPSYMIYRPIRQRMYHILFEGKEANIEEWCANRNLCMEGPEMVHATGVQFEGEFPTLGTIWRADAPQIPRWKLFLCCLGINVSIPELQEIEPRYITLCCLLNYLRNSEGIRLKAWETRSFICQALHPLNNDVTNIHRLQLGVPCPRAVSLSSIFLRGISNVLNVVGACGLPFPTEEAMPWKYFDGKVFHYAYHHFKESPENKSAISNFFANSDALLQQHSKLYFIATK